MLDFYFYRVYSSTYEINITHWKPHQTRCIFHKGLLLQAREIRPVFQYYIFVECFPHYVKMILLAHIGHK